MTESVDILALGEALIEFVQLPEDIDGRPAYRQGFGGDTSNVVIAAARQGAWAGYISAVGGDPFGDELMGLWTREGVNTDTVIVRPQDPTGVYFVQPHPSGRRFSYARRGSAASLFGPDDVPEKAIAEAKILHVSALSQAISASMRDAVTRAAEIAKANDTLVSYDTNLRLNLWTLEDAKAAISAFLPLADIVLPSDDEARQLFDLSEPGEIVDRVTSFGPDIVVLKQGENGALLAQGKHRHTIAAEPAEAVDSTGAGDSFTGAFLAHLLETGDAVEAAKRAALVASKTVAGMGAVDPIPRRADLPF